MQISVTILAHTDHAELIDVEFTIEDDEVCWSVVDLTPALGHAVEAYIKAVGEEGVVVEACLNALKEID